MITTYPDHRNLLVYRDRDGREHPLTTAREWQTRRGRILEGMQQAMGPLPDRSRLQPLAVRVLSEEKLPHFIRRKISFVTERFNGLDDRLPAYLLTPHDLSAPAPAMLCLHQTNTCGKDEPAGTNGLPNLHYAEHLAQRGYVTLAPDYPLGVINEAFRGIEYRCDAYAHGYLSTTMKGIWNHMRAVDMLQSLDYVDAARIGCIGHSLGGHNSMFVAAFDTRLKAVVSSCGFTAFQKYMEGNLTGWTHRGYMPRIASVYGKDPRRMPFDFTQVVAALAPRPFFTNSPLHDDNFDVSGVRDCLDAARTVYELLGAPDGLDSIHPDCAHDFPEPARARAYAWLDHWLK